MKFTGILLVLVALMCVASGATASWPNPLKSMWMSLYPTVEPKPADSEYSCRGCKANRVEEPDPVLTELRVEYVKQQILRKLRLEKPPEVSISISTLPKPLINGRVLDLKPGEPLQPPTPAESFYGKTNQIVVFPNEGRPK
ncbi:hypothetical protein QAD02_006612 [Eretmocerus hayati]|uniref:Uncharacterized protein n=1 Tax=Eretmocerus hayati TaxID=131215 RepID=A0ACC2N5M7_9HYME|nr:hypothetical protein QAD02_006612 [Eretmocerus hayati]